LSTSSETAFKGFSEIYLILSSILSTGAKIRIFASQLRIEVATVSRIQMKMVLDKLITERILDS
jgi:hypothetical protein